MSKTFISLILWGLLLFGAFAAYQRYQANRAAR